MTENSETKDLNYYIEWLNNSITEEHIRYYNYSDFTNIQRIGRGSHGNVVRVNWKNSNRLFALKSFINDKQTLKEVVKELKLLRSVDDHENIIRLYGITIIEGIEEAIHQMNKYSLVLEYANNGTLNTYLNKHFDELDWNEKYLLALQLASAVEFLHEKDIIHRDLQTLDYQKKIAESTSNNTSKIFGVIPYIDPKSFNNQKKAYKLNKKSDVYSVGVLLWQISSGYEPFKSKGFDYDTCLILNILNGEREEMIEGTPVEYNRLYTECWKYESNERPDMQDVVALLKAIVSSEQNDPIIYDNYEEKELKEYKSKSMLSKGTIDINNDLMNNVSSLNLNELGSGIILKSGNSSTNVSNQKTEPSIDNMCFYKNQLLINPERGEDEKADVLTKTNTKILPIDISKLNIQGVDSPTINSSILEIDDINTQTPGKLTKKPSAKSPRLFRGKDYLYFKHGFTYHTIFFKGPALPWINVTIKDISKEDRKRQEAIYELISTENSYHRDLQMIVEVYYGPLQCILSQNELDIIFSNIEDILLCSTTILSDLEQRQKDDKLFVNNIGDIILKLSDNLGCYEIYCGEQLNASKYLRKKREEDKTFLEFLKKAQQDPRCGSLNLLSILMIPLQRITNYPSLIRQILRYTSKDHSDQEDLMRALQKIEAIIESTNEAAREQENKLAEISKLVDLEDLEEKLDLTSTTRSVGKRQFILEGVLKKAKSGRNLYGYLFNDLLLLTQHNKISVARGYQYVLYKPPILLNEIVVKSGQGETFQIIHIEDVIRKSSVNTYCQVQLNRQIFKTKVVKDDIFPHWNQYLMFSVTTLEDTLKLSVYQYDKYSEDEYLGKAEIGLHFLEHYGGNETDKIKLQLKDVAPGRPFGSISVYLNYKPF
ncbi:hypothetical protein RclHR1_00780002 [Rhizophagus clarus]|uniref:Protein kinase domain-containing protein n=1 Tax=Rhizophagus clarus TaxID=94130 RepID=A0A2Z6SDX8_9GLOM|nr:hypothetical protein RclHR1_00780002 [Rhizophagus clarus]